MGVSLSNIAGTGFHGSITAADVERAVKSAREIAPSPMAMAAPLSTQYEGYTEVEITPIRRVSLPHHSNENGETGGQEGKKTMYMRPPRRAWPVFSRRLCIHSAGCRRSSPSVETDSSALLSHRKLQRRQVARSLTDMERCFQSCTYSWRSDHESLRRCVTKGERMTMVGREGTQNNAETTFDISLSAPAKKVSRGTLFAAILHTSIPLASFCCL